MVLNIFVELGTEPIDLTLLISINWLTQYKFINSVCDRPFHTLLYNGNKILILNLYLVLFTVKDYLSGIIVFHPGIQHQPPLLLLLTLWYWQYKYRGNIECKITTMLQWTLKIFAGLQLLSPPSLLFFYIKIFMANSNRSK